jgi:hypothetical protein
MAGTAQQWQTRHGNHSLGIVEVGSVGDARGPMARPGPGVPDLLRRPEPDPPPDGSQTILASTATAETNRSAVPAPVPKGLAGLNTPLGMVGPNLATPRGPSEILWATV